MPGEQIKRTMRNQKKKKVLGSSAGDRKERGYLILETGERVARGIVRKN